MPKYLHDATKVICKMPYGAVPKNSTVHLTVCPGRSSGIKGGYLEARFERDADRSVSVPLYWRGMDGSRDLFSAILPVGDYTGLIWYSFRLEAPYGQSFTVGDYRLTVYDESIEPPTWFGEGITYQIFPDRFARSRIPDPTGMVGNRWVHENWTDEPEYRPNEHGEIRNRDFFGGDLKGIVEKLPYLKSLGVSTIYLTPIFEAAENHRYGTADYERIDPMLGDNETFVWFCQQVHEQGMYVMLDGVFNHTGFISRYFGGDDYYDDVGARQSQNSPYRNWFHFKNWPNEYDSWWGIYSLPAVNESDPLYRQYMLEGRNSIIRRWLYAGADGWRLDVADELPDDFIEQLRCSVYEENPQATVIGEVWEDGTTKIAYGVRREHLLGRHLDGLMNYPFRNALIGYLQGDDAERFMEEMETLRMHYPHFAYYGGMNSLGTHDTPRIITLLGTGDLSKGKDKDWKAHYRMSPDEYELGKRLLKLGALVMYCFPGSPTVYYGDESGLEGFEDPFNRRSFRPDEADNELLEYFRLLGRARNELIPLRKGGIQYVTAQGPLLAFIRRHQGEQVLCAVNRGKSFEHLSLPWYHDTADELISGRKLILDEDGMLGIDIPPTEGILII